MPFLGQAQPIDHAVDGEAVDGEAWEVARPVLASLLRGELPRRESLRSLLARPSGVESVVPYVAFELQALGGMERMDEAVRERLRRLLHEQQMVHLASEIELARVVAALGEAGIRALLIKGHAVGRTHYPSPLCRPTYDIDLLVEPERVERALTVLSSLGYAGAEPVPGRLLYASHAVLTAEPDGGFRFNLDLHWDITNRLFFRRRMGFEGLWGSALELEIEGRTVRVPGDIDALVIACVHLGAMDPGETVELRWLLDVYLLARAVEGGAVEAVLARCRETATTEVCAVYCRLADRLADSGAESELTAALGGAADERIVRRYDRTLESRAYDVALFLKRLPSWAERRRLLRELAGRLVPAGPETAGG